MRKRNKKYLFVPFLIAMLGCEPPPTCSTSGSILHGFVNKEISSWNSSIKTLYPSNEVIFSANIENIIPEKSTPEKITCNVTFTWYVEIDSKKQKLDSLALLIELVRNPVDSSEYIALLSKSNNIKIIDQYNAIFRKISSGEHIGDAGFTNQVE